MSPNTLRVQTENVLVKSVGPQVLWAVAVETMSAGGWRIFPSPPVQCLNSKSGDRGGVAIYRREVQPVSQALVIFIPSLWVGLKNKFHNFQAPHGPVLYIESYTKINVHFDTFQGATKVRLSKQQDEDHERYAAQRYPTHVQSVTYPANTQAKEEAVPAANQDRI
ncbi:hypothetical protein TNCV_782081 [Trichonephila clavipes]|nr:hypothetical protein TNCV_782081 [Trichonephila clavipes]